MTAEFEENLAFVHEMNFAGGHVFTYSARPGTAAAHFPDQTPMNIRKKRSTRLRQVLIDSSEQYKRSFIGQSLSVLWESATAFDSQGWELSGLTDNYLRVQARASRHLWNCIHAGSPRGSNP